MATSTNARGGLFALLRRFPRQRRTMMRCELCELTGGPFRADEAAALLRIHQQLQHGRFPAGPALPPLTAD